MSPGGAILLRLAMVGSLLGGAWAEDSPDLEGVWNTFYNTGADLGNGAEAYGFAPPFGADIRDLSLVAGLRGERPGGLRWDASLRGARSDIEFYIHNTISASRGPATPTSFHPRDYIQTEVAANLDFSYAVDAGSLASPLGLAWGAEWRQETFESVAGDEVSTGFRAPSPGQANLRAVPTGFSGTGGLTEQGQVPPAHPIPIAAALGGVERCNGAFWYSRLFVDS